MNWFGLGLGFSTLLTIGLGFIWVIRGERFFGYLWWPYIMGLGCLAVLISIFVSNDFLSALLGAFSASLLWGATEIKEQAVRAEMGWYAFNHKKILPPFSNVIRKWKAPSL